MENPVIKKVIFGVPMIYGHDGMALFIKDHAKIDISKLGSLECVVAINRKEDRMKILGCKGLVIGYLRLPKGQKINREAIQFIPRTFGGAGFEYAKAERAALEKRILS